MKLGFLLVPSSKSAAASMLQEQKLNYPKTKINLLNPLTPNDQYSGRTAPVTSKGCILYIYSTNISTEYFKRCIYCPFLSLQNAVYFTILTYLIPVLFIFYIEDVLKFHNSNVFGSCIIHILYTGCAKIS